MKIEVEVKFNIGDKVLVKKTTGCTSYAFMKDVSFPLKAVITGFVITKDTKRTTVNYFIEPIELDKWQSRELINATSHRRRYPAKYLEKVED